MRPATAGCWPSGVVRQFAPALKAISSFGESTGASPAPLRSSRRRGDLDEDGNGQVRGVRVPPPVPTEEQVPAAPWPSADDFTGDRRDGAHLAGSHAQSRVFTVSSHSTDSDLHGWFNAPLG